MAAPERIPTQRTRTAVEADLRARRATLAVLRQMNDDTEGRLQRVVDAEKAHLDLLLDELLTLR